MRFFALLLFLPVIAGCSQPKAVPSQVTPEEPDSESAATAMYDWRAQTLDAKRAAAGGNARILIKGLSTLCYTYEVDTEERVRQDRPSNIGGLIAAVSGAELAQPAAERPQSAAEGEPSLEDRAQQVLIAAREVGTAVQGLCEGPRRSIGADLSILEGLDEPKELRQKKEKLDSTVAEIVRTGGAVLSAPQDSLIITANTAYENAMELLSAAKAAVNRDRLVEFVAVGDDAEAIEVKVVAIGREEMPTYGDTIRDDFEISVEGNDRFFASAGFMISFLREHDYQRQNVPVFSEANPDSTISTFVNRKGGRGPFAHAPAALVNYEIGRGVTASGGLVQRTVGGDPSLEYVLGLGYRLGEDVLITGAWHVGRKERLLIPTRAEDGTLMPIPAAVTRESAVGRRWDSAVALLFSWNP